MERIGSTGTYRIFVYSLLFKKALSLSDADRARAFATTLASRDPYECNGREGKGRGEEGEMVMVMVMVMMTMMITSNKEGIDRT